jgi:hypothetical protein
LWRSVINKTSSKTRALRGRRLPSLASPIRLLMRFDGPIFLLTSLGGLLYSAAAGLPHVAVAAGNKKGIADENASESHACLRPACLAHSSRSISITRKAQLLNKLASPAAEAHLPPTGSLSEVFVQDACLPCEASSTSPPSPTINPNGLDPVRCCRLSWILEKSFRAMVLSGEIQVACMSACRSIAGEPHNVIS